MNDLVGFIVALVALRVCQIHLVLMSVYERKLLDITTREDTREAFVWLAKSPASRSFL
jgi:hypothetical protein